MPCIIGTPAINTVNISTDTQFPITDNICNYLGFNVYNEYICPDTVIEKLLAFNEHNNNKVLTEEQVKKITNNKKYS